MTDKRNKYILPEAAAERQSVHRDQRDAYNQDTKEILHNYARGDIYSPWLEAKKFWHQTRAEGSAEGTNRQKEMENAARQLRWEQAVQQAKEAAASQIPYQPKFRYEK